MKNILLLSSLYPADDVKFLNNTSVCHYFAKEWKKLGYNVRVIVLYYNFHRFYYPLLRLANKYIANKSGNAVLDKYLPDEHCYELDGISITRLPIKKSRPGGIFYGDDLDYVANRIYRILLDENFSPDLILGHFLHPSIEIETRLKKYYNVPNAISLHGKEKVFSSEVASLLPNIDFFGYRSHPIGDCFEHLYGKKKHFYCFSGVPASYVVSKHRDFKRGVNKFIYVGSLIERKHPVCLISAICKAYKDNEFKITFVGEGAQKNKIIKEASRYNCLQNIYFTGHIKRDDVTLELDNADVFIMLSIDETFGLVYLEAMARGCIVIASQNEGMDGIISHGENGFLCNAGDSEELQKILLHIQKLSNQELSLISSSAIATAEQMNDKKMAIEYINFFKIQVDNAKR